MKKRSKAEVYGDLNAALDRVIDMMEGEHTHDAAVVCAGATMVFLSRLPASVRKDVVTTIIYSLGGGDAAGLTQAVKRARRKTQ